MSNGSLLETTFLKPFAPQRLIDNKEEEWQNSSNNVSGINLV